MLQPTPQELPPASERTEALRAALLAEKYSICLERPELLAAFAGSKEGRAARAEHPLVRRALSLSHVLSHRKPRVYPDELIIGNLTSKRVAANYYPEGGSLNVLEDLFRLEKRAVPLSLTLSEKWRLARIALRTATTSVGGRALLRPGRLSYFFDFFRARRYFVTEEAGIGHQVGGYPTVVREGLGRADEEAALRLRTGALEDGSALDPDQEAFFRSVRIAIGGIRAMAANLAAEAQRQADEAGVPAKRRAELLASAEACRRVPFAPARSFLEGLQACWLVHVALNLEDFEQGLSFGRLDQLLLPLYRADLAAGTLTYGAATELAAGFCLKTCEAIPLYSERVDRFFSGNAVAEGITLGGTGPEGGDATNELSGLFLDAFAQVRTREPALHVRVHPSTPRWFLEKAVEVLQLGCGKPSFFGDLAVVKALETAGMSTLHARDYAVIGCVEMASQGRTYNSSDAALFNLPLCLELALNEGRPFGERRRLGAATPPVAQLSSFDVVVKAFSALVVDAAHDMTRLLGWLEEVYRVHRPTPVNSMITEGCLARGRDV
ncbi:MAG: pyruvate formate lyase family protein, partial [Myxococcaceae bacterium]